MKSAPQPSLYGTIWYLPDKKRTIKKAMQLLELRRKPKDKHELRQLMTCWRSGPEGPWGCSCGTVDEWIAVMKAKDAYLWLLAQVGV